MLYCRQKKIPVAVFERLAKQGGSASRVGINFHEEKALSPLFRSKLHDYFRFYHLLGINRGHMAAAGNYTHDEQQMRDTFSLANILPQDGDNNQDLWLSL